MEAPLHGVMVLDLTRLLPGPYATQVLADLGADVIKVEDPGAGDYLRRMPPYAGGHGAMFLALNRGKRAITLDLKTPAGVDALLGLVRTAQVVVEGFRPGVMARLGLGFEALRAVNPAVVLCSLSGYGQDGPDAGRAGHDLDYVARAGVLGYGAPGTLLPVQVADVGGALWAVAQILAALRLAERTGQGAHVDVSLTEAAWSFLAMPLGAALAGGQPLAPGADLLNGGVPCYRPYRTADGRTLAVAALEPPFWSALCEALERPDLAPCGMATGAEGQRVQRELEAIFGARSAAEWQAQLSGRDCCVELAHPPESAHVQDAQLRTRGLTVQVDQPGSGTVELPVTPVRISGYHPDLARPAPAQGQHQADVLGAPVARPPRLP